MKLYAFGALLVLQISSVDALALAGFDSVQTRGGVDGGLDLNVRQTESVTYLGCFKDGSPRVLRHGAPSNPTATSFQYCADACFAAGYALAGVENGHECYCGNGFLYDYGPGAVCSTPCPGDASNTCGGSLALQIYSTGAGPYTTGPASFVVAYNGFKATECWEDNSAFGGSRPLPHSPHVSVPSASMTVEKCIDACAAAPTYYTSAGLEWGQECYCGNVTYPIGESTVPQECERPCNGNAAEYCGDADRMLVYTSLPWDLTFP